MPYFSAMVFFNMNIRNAMFDGYTEGDQLHPSRLDALQLEASSPLSAAEGVFSILNSDDRPNGAYERSLSVGDVVRLYHAPSESFFHFAVEGTGMKGVQIPAGVCR